MVNPEQLSEVVFQCAMLDHQALWEQKKSRIMEQLAPDEVKLLLGHSLRLVKQRGETLYLGDDDVARMYILDRGYVRFCRMKEDGGRLITGFLGPADIFGPIFTDAAAGSPHGANDDFIEVVREARLIAVESSVFRAVLERHPAFLLRMVEILEARKTRLEKRVLSLVAKDVYAQTAEILLELSGKFGETCACDPALACDISLTHQEIADLVGVARPTVSKVISDMLKADLLRKHRQNLCLYNRQGIAILAEQGQKGFHSL